MTRPTNLIYGVDERPPALICLISAAQMLTILAPILIYPTLVMRASGASEAAIAQTVSISFLALGIGAVLQAQTSRWLGSGYLVTIAPAAAYVPVAIAALKAGGPSLLMGMTLIAGFSEMAFAQVIQRLRAFFPTEISGLCVLLIGMILGVLGLRATFGLGTAEEQVVPQVTASAREVALSAATLALMIGLNLWGRGPLRMYCAIIGIVAGYIACMALDPVDGRTTELLATSSVLAPPPWTPALPAFSAALTISFMAAALTSALRGMGDITTAQKINDADWIRPDMLSIRNGIAANGLATMISALAGGIGGNTQSSSVGMSNATGITSRRVAYWVCGLLLLLSASPMMSAVLVAAPSPVIGASFLFTACFIMVNGLQIITSRLLDARRTFIIGLALTLSLSHDLLPGLYERGPGWLQPFTSSGLAIGLISALLLNAVFRLGVRSRAVMTLARDGTAHQAVRAFLEQQGARWGARRDVMARATFGTAQAIESITEHCNVHGPITVAASFDEFNLDIRISYQGELLALEDRRPTDDEIRDTADGIRRLAGFLLQRNADRTLVLE
jgi:xanthine permease XanP